MRQMSSTRWGFVEGAQRNVRRGSPPAREREDGLRAFKGLIFGAAMSACLWYGLFIVARAVVLLHFSPFR